jgi:DNA primase
MTNFYECLAELCLELLNSYPGANVHKNYILNRLSQNTINKYMIGYFPGNNESNLLLDKFDLDLLINKKLIYKNYYDTDISNICIKENRNTFFSEHRLVIPFLDTYGKVIAFAGRSILSEKERQELGIPKYKNEVFNKSDYLFNMNNAKEEIINKDYIFLVEGQFDCISCVDNGINNVVALGSSSLSAKQFALILRYTNNIYMLLDNDEGGLKGRDLILKKYSKYANIKNVFLPKSYKDVDDFFKDNSVLDFQLFADI